MWLVLEIKQTNLKKKNILWFLFFIDIVYLFICYFYYSLVACYEYSCVDKQSLNQSYTFALKQW